MARGHDSVSRSPERQSDPAIAAAEGGDQTAWDTLVDRHAQLVWSTARRFAVNKVAAADVCGLTWARLADHVHELDTDAELREWLRSTAEREARRALGACRSSTLSGPAPIGG
jgi:RNA polymerase sigma factor (sigma-70 family)